MIVIYISWKTKIESQKTGIQLHKIANVVDENHFYNVCNHLSLKLLNHQLNFTACGFFDLDMTTVYAVSLNNHHLLKSQYTTDVIIYFFYTLCTDNRCNNKLFNNIDSI